jgi:hypothetical protein
VAAQSSPRERAAGALNWRRKGSDERQHKQQQAMVGVGPKLGVLVFSFGPPLLETIGGGSWGLLVLAFFVVIDGGGDD